MKNKHADFGPAARTPEQIRAQEFLNKRRNQDKAQGQRFQQQVLKIVEEVVAEQLRLLRITPFPTCPQCGRVFRGPATLYEHTTSKVTMAAADQILRGIPFDH